MMPPSDTPPDGDFARYVERLTGSSKAVADRHNDRFTSRESDAASPSFAASASPPSVKTGLESLRRIPFWTHIKWLVVLWIAVQVLARFIPGTGFLFIPVLAFYAVWAIVTLRRKSPGGFLNELREWARRAAEDARKAQASQQRNKP